jgi:acetyl-CoA C-acetyltransferase
MVLASKNIPESVPGTSVDRQCGSSQQAIHFAAQAVMSGVQDVVIAAGVEHMTSTPIGSNIKDGFTARKSAQSLPMNDSINDAYGKRLEERGLQMFSQFEGAEILAENYNISRKEMDESAVASHAKALHASNNGYFKREIVPLMGKDKKGNEVVHDRDEGIRPKTNMASLSKLPDMKSRGKNVGRITAGLSSQICDGAAAILFCNARGLRKLGLQPRARICALAVAGDDPVQMLGGPIPATKKALEQAKMTMEEMDLYEVNEAFASVPLAWLKALGADKNKLNVNGGAMALGHPLGGTGAKLMVTLLHEMERRGSKYGIQAICEGGGTANATIIERIPTGSKM